MLPHDTLYDLTNFWSEPLLTCVEVGSKMCYNVDKNRLNNVLLPTSFNVVNNIV